MLKLQVRLNATLRARAILAHQGSEYAISGDQADFISWGLTRASLTVYSFRRVSSSMPFSYLCALWTRLLRNEVHKCMFF